MDPYAMIGLFAGLLIVSWLIWENSRGRKITDTVDKEELTNKQEGQQKQQR